MKKTLRRALGCIALLCIVALAAKHARASAVAVMAMSPHMEMTVKSAVKPGDRERAAAILAALKTVMAKYRDVRTAQADGFAEFKPELHLPQAHFTNMAYAREAWSGRFDPLHPTSLMYRRAAHGWELEGAMYTAPASATQAQLDAAAPLSIAQWHRHTNFCAGPAGSTARDYYGPGARFGLAGSIADAASCAAAGGTFKPQIFGWMLHVWPMESDPAKVWELHPHGDGDGAMQGMHR